MIAVDTNLLVYAYRPDYEAEHAPARAALASLANGQAGWAIPWPCVHEFVANVTNRKLYRQPAGIDEAFVAVNAWSQSPFFDFIGEQGDHPDLLSQLSRRGGVSGGQVHDARIAAICLSHGVSELWTADRDFLRFPDLRVRNPLTDHTP